MSSESPTGKTSSPLWPRVRVYAIVCTLFGVILALIAAGFLVLRHAFIHGLEITDRLYWLVCAALLLTSPALVARHFIRTKRATGSWKGSPEHNRRQIAQCAMRPQPRTTPHQRSLVAFGMHWANIAARDPRSSVFKRIVGGLVLIVYAAVLLALCVLSVIFVGAGFATIASFGWAMILFGLILLIIPAQFIAAIVRRRRIYGDLRSSDDDLHGIMAARSLWFEQLRQQSLRSKLISTAIVLAVLTMLWIRAANHHQGHSHPDWTFPLFWTLAALYLIWNQFRRPKSSPAK